MSTSKRKNVAVTLMLGMALTPCAAPLSAKNAVSQEPATPFSRLYRSLNVRPGVYYLASPEIVTSASDVRDIKIDLKVKQVRLGTGYVMVYGEHEKLSGRAVLAKMNMKIIRSHLAADSLVMPKGSTMESMGLPEIDSLFEGLSQVCRLRFVDGPGSRLVVAAAGTKLSRAQVCVGFGISMALAGYRIEAVKQGLEFRRVVDVVQGSAVEGDRSARLN